MNRTGWMTAWTGLIVCAAVPISAQPLDSRARSAVAPTCDARRINPDSYALTTRAQAAIVNQDRLDWWDGFNVGDALRRSAN